MVFAQFLMPSCFRKGKHSNIFRIATEVRQNPQEHAHCLFVRRCVVVTVYLPHGRPMCCPRLSVFPSWRVPFYLHLHRFQCFPACKSNSSHLNLLTHFCFSPGYFLLCSTSRELFGRKCCTHTLSASAHLLPAQLHYSQAFASMQPALQSCQLPS